MKIIYLILLMSGMSFASLKAQDSREKVIESRAREMHRVLTLDDPAEWKKFIRDNYTPALIARKMQKKTQVEEEGVVSQAATETTEETNLDGKAKMFARLHEDFGNSKVSSIKINGDAVEMAVTGGMGTGIFRLKFELASPYRIDGLGIEIKNQP